jgi:serine/threonine protein kinase
LLVPGTTVAGYKIESLIGRGGMGAVYRAEEEGLARKVALKVIAPELAQDERFRERFLRESRIAASLDHPHVVPIYQAGEEDGVLYLAMRYVEGADLQELVAEEGALEPKRALDLLSQVAEALDAAHEKGLVHRDVKPSNILIAGAAGREHCYLGDFGLTKRTGSLSGVSAAGEVVGTLEYVAPEQITGASLDERADVYSLGCVLYECLTGRSPFPRATDVALLWAHVHEEPTPPSQARPELPRELDTVLARALAKEPGRRYRSAGELVAATRSALRLVETSPSERKTSRWLVPAIAAFALLAAAAVLGLVLTGGSGGLSGVSPNSVGVIDPSSNELVGEVPVGVDPLAIATGAGSVWVANFTDKTLTRINPADIGARAHTIPLGDNPSDVAVAAGTIWVAFGVRAELARVDPEQEVVGSSSSALGEAPACNGPNASVDVGGGYVWFVCENADYGKFNPRTNIGQSLGVACGLTTSSSSLLPSFSDVAFDRRLGAVWVANRAANTVTGVDPVICQNARPITVGASPTAIAVGENALWVTNFDDDTVWRIEIAASGQPPVTTRIDVGDGPVDVAVGEGAVWVANKLGQTVTRIDPDSGEVEDTVGLGNEPQRIAAGEGRVWVTVRAPENGTATTP